MRTAVMLAALATVIPVKAASQIVVADIQVIGGPVSGRVVIGHPPYYHRHAPVVVSHHHRPYYDHRPVYLRHGPPGQVRKFHRAYLWYHPATRRYYHRPHPSYRGLVRVSVREHDGRYWYDD